jgi:hypothetical protein
MTEVVRRHESLRTSFPAEGGTARQVISDPPPVEARVVDLGGLGAAEREARARLLADEEARRPFDLARGPLWRVKLLKLGEEEHILLFIMHHIVSDAWSTGVLMREVAKLYAAFLHGQPSPLPELPVQYADFAAWQRRWLQGETLERQLAYWREQLAGAPPVLELPAARPRPAALGTRGESRPVVLPEESVEALRSLSRRAGVTLYMTLLAAFQTLLHRYSGEDEVVVGSPVANRTRAESEDLIGCFINTVALRGDLSGNPTFGELLGRVRETTLEAYAHQDLPFEMLVNALQPERRANHTPFFQVWFVLQTAPVGSLALPGLSVSPYRIEPAESQFDLTMSLLESEGGVEGLLTYNADLFDADVVDAMVEHYLAILEQAASDPEWRLLDIPLDGSAAGGAVAPPPSASGADAAEDQFEL